MTRSLKMHPDPQKSLSIEPEIGVLTLVAGGSSARPRFTLTSVRMRRHPDYACHELVFGAGPMGEPAEMVVCLQLNEKVIAVLFRGLPAEHDAA